MKRKFKALKDQFGLDDLGASGITFEVQSIKKGEIYEEHLEWIDAKDGIGELKARRSGYVIDDNGCWWEIGTNKFKKLFQRIKDQG